VAVLCWWLSESVALRAIASEAPSLHYSCALVRAEGKQAMHQLAKCSICCLALVSCCLAGPHSVAQRLVPMYIPGQVCVKRTDGGLWCFSEKSNNELPAFSLGCSNTASIEVDGNQKHICLPIEIDPRVFEDQQAKLRDDLRRRAEELRRRLKDPAVIGSFQAPRSRARTPYVRHLPLRRWRCARGASGKTSSTPGGLRGS
jgi:hypothetical protein